MKAFLTQAGVRVTAEHLFLRVADWLGFDTYARIWAPHLDDGEALYGAMLFSEQMGRVLSSESLAEKRLSVFEDGAELPIPSRRFFRAFGAMHERVLDRFDFRQIHLVGLTLNFGQTLASAYIAKLIKARAPNVKVVIGGAEATGDLGRSLLTEFPQFDMACSGEGEQPLLELVQALSRGTKLPGSLLSRSRRGPASAAQQQPQLDELPVPDFIEYFEAISELGHDALDVCEHLPFETSRGCHYSCSFCALNLQWRGYREAGAEVVGAKMNELRKAHGILSFLFVDNVMPPGVERIAANLATHAVDYSLFYEARSNVRRSTWKALAEAGLRKTQIGIEALSDELLRVFNKKATVLHHLQALKNCYEFGIAVSANIIVGHPLATETHVSQSLEAFEYVRAFPPALSISYYALLVGSQDYLDGIPGVEVTGNYSGYGRAYPTHMLRRMCLPRKDFHSTAGEPADFAPLIRLIERWENDYSRLQARFGGREPIVALQDGGDFLRIDDWRSGERTTFTLDARERLVYLSIGQAKPIHTVCEETGLSRGWVLGALAAFDVERIAYVRSGWALALALRKRGAPG